MFHQPTAAAAEMAGAARGEAGTPRPIQPDQAAAAASDVHAELGPEIGVMPLAERCLRESETISIGGD